MVVIPVKRVITSDISCGIKPHHIRFFDGVRWCFCYFVANLFGTDFTADAVFGFLVVANDLQAP